MVPSEFKGPYVSIKEAARHLRVSPNFMYKHIQDGTGPPMIRFGTKLIRIPLDGLMEWFNQPGRRDGDV